MTTTRGVKAKRCGALIEGGPTWVEMLAILRRMVERACKTMSEEEMSFGRLEELLGRDANRLVAMLLEAAAQRQADEVELKCRRCGQALTKGRKSPVTKRTPFGPVRVVRARGWCPRCEDWRCPADEVLGWHGSESPGMAELTALLASQMPLEDAAHVLERVTRRPQARATVARSAQREGERALALRQSVVVKQSEQVLQAERPFTLVLEIDAWNIRERDHWGQGAADKPPERWHWVYTGTVFKLSDQVVTGSGRREILERGYAATRQGPEALSRQIHHEAMNRGLGRAQRVLILADGAAWIWNIARDRFAGAVQRLDLYHAKSHLWGFANACFGENSPQARSWMRRHEQAMERGRPEKWIPRLEKMLESLEGAAREAAAKELNYFQNHSQRMDYADAARQGEPCGSGAVESTCGQYQCRLKRPGQFWSTAGDEALLALVTFRFNRRWDFLFPHVADPSQN